MKYHARLQSPERQLEFQQMVPLLCSQQEENSASMRKRVREHEGTRREVCKEREGGKFDLNMYACLNIK